MASSASPPVRRWGCRAFSARRPATTAGPPPVQGRQRERRLHRDGGPVPRRERQQDPPSGPSVRAAQARANVHALGAARALRSPASRARAPPARAPRAARRRVVAIRLGVLERHARRLEPRLPHRARRDGRDQPAVRDQQREVPARHRGHDGAQVAAQERLRAGEADEQRAVAGRAPRRPRRSLAASSSSAADSARCSQRWQNDSQRGESCQVQCTGAPFRKARTSRALRAAGGPGRPARSPRAKGVAPEAARAPAARSGRRAASATS